MAEEDKQEPKFDFTREGEALGYISVGQARVLAIRHAQENPDFYGPAYSGVRLAWEVTSQEEGEDFYDIRLSFRPAGRFRGEPGVEQFIIDKTGDIQVHQILDEPAGMEAPARRRPRFLLISAVGVVVVAVVAIVVGFTIGNLTGGGEGPAPTSLPAPTPTLAPAVAPPTERPAPTEVLSGNRRPFPSDALRRVVVLEENFESGLPRDVNLGPGATTDCEPGNCFLRHVATQDQVPHSSFGRQFWEDYAFRFRFNVRTEVGGPAALWRVTPDNDRYVLDGDASWGFSLAAVQDGATYPIDGIQIQAPIAIGEWHELGIESVGTQVRVLLDGRAIWQDAFPEGKVPLAGTDKVY